MKILIRCLGFTTAMLLITQITLALTGEFNIISGRELMQATLASNARILAARHEVQAAVENMNQIISRHRPQLTGVYSQGHQRTSNDTLNDNISDQGFLRQISLRGTYTLDFNGRQDLELQQAQEHVKIAELQLEQIIGIVMHEVAEAHVNAYHIDQQVALQKKYLIELNEQLAQIEKMISLKLFDKTALFAISQQILIANQEMIKLENDLSASLNHLERLTGYNISSSALARPYFFADIPSNLTEVANKALSQALAINIAEARVELARFQYEAAIKDRYPIYRLETTINQEEFSDDKDRDTTILFSIEYPIFEGGAHMARIRELSNSFEAAKHSLVNTKHHTERVVREVWQNHKSFLEYRTLWINNLELAHDNLKDVEALVYDQQQVVFALMRAQQATLEAKMRIQTNLREIDLAALRLLLETGELQQAYKLSENSSMMYSDIRP